MIDDSYVQLLTEIQTYGADSDDRTGVGTKSLFGAQLVTTVEDNILPAISVRRVAPRIAFEELMFMLNGETDTKKLEAKQINIWKGNTSREFLDSRGLEYLEVGEMGRMYGTQLRNFTGDKNREIVSYDQLVYMVREIKTNPKSRRIIATHYNPAEADQGVLFPCHIMTQFNVRNGQLDCLFWMRSSDVGYGLPYNLMYYGMFCNMMAKLCGYEPGRLVYQAGDAHLYKDQIACGMIDYMENNIHEVKTIPRFYINKDLDTIEDMLSLTWDDVSVEGYDPCRDFADKPGMAV